MNAQHAPCAALHWAALVALKSACKNSQSINAGSVMKSSHATSTVSTILSGEEKSLSRHHPAMPAAATGGGMSREPELRAATLTLHQRNAPVIPIHARSEEHTSELQSLMRS